MKLFFLRRRRPEERDERGGSLLFSERETDWLQSSVRVRPALAPRLLHALRHSPLSHGAGRPDRRGGIPRREGARGRAESGHYDSVFFLVSFFLREAAASKESEREREHLLDRVLRKRQKKSRERVHEGSNFGVLRHGFIWRTVGDLCRNARNRKERRRRRRGRREGRRGRREGRREGGGRTTSSPSSTSLPLYLSPPSLPSRALQREGHKPFSLPKRFKTRPLTTRACTLAASKKE